MTQVLEQLDLLNFRQPELTAFSPQKTTSFLDSPKGLSAVKSGAKKYKMSCGSSECETNEDSDHDHSERKSHFGAFSPFEYSDAPQQQQQQQQQQQGGKKQHSLDQVKYKTEMCRNWEQFQFCNYGTKCRYAHGVSELKGKVNVNQYYRTRKCKLYHEQGYCSYGTRCHFIHELKHHMEVVKESKVSYSTLLTWGLPKCKRLPIFERIAPSASTSPSSEKSSSSSVTFQ